MKTCIQCQHFNLKELPKLAPYGFAWCKHMNITYENGEISRSSVVSASKEQCSKFQEVDTEISHKRIEWIKKQEMR